MTQKKKQKGFTLVEVIVVAVIVAVLAAVAVPIYMNYVESSKANQAENIAGSMASFCGACAAEDGDCAATNPVGTAAGETSCGANDATATIPPGFSVSITLPTATTKGAVTCTPDGGSASETHNF